MHNIIVIGFDIDSRDNIRRSLEPLGINTEVVETTEDAVPFLEDSGREFNLLIISTDTTNFYLTPPTVENTEKFLLGLESKLKVLKLDPDFRLRMNAQDIRKFVGQELGISVEVGGYTKC